MIPKQASRFDEHRNTSRVWPVTPRDGENARHALAQFRRDQPALVAWIEDGYPTLTDAEHLERFGEPYVSHRARRATIAA